MTALAEWLAPEWLNWMRRRHGDVAIRIESGYSDFLLRQLDDALLDIAVLGEEDPETGVPEVIYVAKERIDQAESQFTINVDRQPVSVGIDPFNKMIDRNPDDNVTRVSIAEE